MDLGLSNGKPRARSQINEAVTPLIKIMISNVFEILFKKLTESSADTKEHSVVVHFLHAVVLQQDSGVGIHIGPGVLDLAGFVQDRWDNHVHVGYQLEQLVIGKMLQCELTLTCVSGIGFAQNSMTISGYHLSGFQESPNVVFQLVFGSIITNILDHLGQEDQDFLIGQAVQWSS